MHAYIRQPYLRMLYWITGSFLGILVAVWLFPSPGTGDVGLYQELIERFRTDGSTALVSCITQTCPPAHLWNYPPLYLFIFFAGQLITGSVLTSFFIHKLLIAIFFFGALFLLGYISRTQHAGDTTAALSRPMHAVFLGCTGIAMLINTQGLGYIDIFTFPCLILAFYYLSKHAYFWGGVFLAGACLIKFLPVLLIPFFLLFVVRKNAKSLRQFLLGFGGITASVSIFSWGIDIFPVASRIITALTQDPYFAAAPNIPWIWTMLFSPLHIPLSDDLLLYLTEGNTTPILAFMYRVFKLIFLGYYGWVLYRYARTKDTASSVRALLVASVYVYLGYFFIATGVHENHLMIGVFCALLLASMFPQKRYILLYRGIDIASAVSMLLYYGISGRPFFPLTLATLGYPLAVTVLLIIFFVIQLTYMKQHLEQEEA